MEIEKIKIDYIPLENGSENLENVFDMLFEEVFRSTKIDILEAKAQQNLY